MKMRAMTLTWAIIVGIAKGGVKMDWMDIETIKTLKRLQSESTNDGDDFAYCVAIAAVERMSDIEAFNEELQEDNRKLSDKIKAFNEISVKNAELVNLIVQENTNLKRQLEKFQKNS